MPRPVHFEFSADNPEELVKFYEDILGWKVQKWDGPTDYWLFTTGEEGEAGIDGGLMRRDENMPSGTVNTVDVPNIDEYMEKITSAGGQIVAPKMAVPGVGWMCYVMDPEGNVFGLMESDENAK
jgi:predicted enzyme related to lactoylglutathione lyase